MRPWSLLRSYFASDWIQIEPWSVTKRVFHTIGPSEKYQWNAISLLVFSWKAIRNLGFPGFPVSFKFRSFVPRAARGATVTRKSVARALSKPNEAMLVLGRVYR